MRIDLQLLDNDVVITDNDLVIAQSDEQHIIDTINANEGWWKENYLDGVGLWQYLKGRSATAELSRIIAIQLQSDGYKARPIISFDANGKLIINPNVTN